MQSINYFSNPSGDFSWPPQQQTTNITVANQQAQSYNTPQQQQLQQQQQHLTNFQQNLSFSPYSTASSARGLFCCSYFFASVKIAQTSLPFFFFL